jgi:virginiamycin B lyase
VRIGEVPLEPGSGPSDLVTGSDGNLFVAEDGPGVDRVDRVLPDGGIIGQFSLPSGSTPAAITAGPDGNLWVSEFSAKKIARVTTAGGISHFPAGTTVGSPLGIAAVPMATSGSRNWGRTGSDVCPSAASGSKSL